MSPISSPHLPMVSQPMHRLPRRASPVEPIQQEHRRRAGVLDRVPQP